MKDICVTQRKYENQDLIIEVKKLFVLINDWENIIAYWEQFKQRKELADTCSSFHSVNSYMVWEVGSTAPRKKLQFIPPLKLRNSFFRS